MQKCVNNLNEANIFLEKLSKIYSRRSNLTSIKDIKIIIFGLKQVPIKKAPGPQGFIIKLYQTFKKVTNSFSQEEDGALSGPFHSAHLTQATEFDRDITKKKENYTPIFMDSDK